MATTGSGAYGSGGMAMGQGPGASGAVVGTVATGGGADPWRRGATVVAGEAQAVARRAMAAAPTTVARCFGIDLAALGMEAETPNRPGTRQWWHGAAGCGRRVADAAGRRRSAALAGHAGDESTARALLDDSEPAVRVTALGALARMGALKPADAAAALVDPEPAVRRRGCEVAAALVDVDLRPLLADPDTGVVEVAAWALGERESAAVDAVAALAAVATGHDDALCREAAVAALGAIGDEAGLPAILAATADKAAVRRRAVIALAPFSGDAVDAALEAALGDRDWQVRQAAEDLRGRD